MVSNKLFYIEECWFNLPDNFNGTCGDALMLLAKYRLEQESKNKIGSENELLKKDDSGLIPGEIILLAWCSGKNTKKRIPNYFYSSYAVDVTDIIHFIHDKDGKKRN